MMSEASSLKNKQNRQTYNEVHNQNIKEGLSKYTIRNEKQVIIEISNMKNGKIIWFYIWQEMEKPEEMRKNFKWYDLPDWARENQNPSKPMTAGTLNFPKKQKPRLDGGKSKCYQNIKDEYYVLSAS